MKKSSISEALRSCVRDVPDFPVPGVMFKDITPIMKDPLLCDAVVDAFCGFALPENIDVVVGIESRGFLFGMMLANRLQVPFVPIRKKGKLPDATIEQTYDLEYGTACIEIHADAFPSGSRVLVHDDLLATGGTVRAATELVKRLGGTIGGYAFLIELDFLGGRRILSPYGAKVFSLLRYD